MKWSSKKELEARVQRLEHLVELLLASHPDLNSQANTKTEPNA